MAHVVGRRADDLGKKRLRRRVAVQHAILSTLFMVQDELQRNLRAIGPARVWGTASVTAQVARVSHCRAPNTERRSTRVSLRSSSMRSENKWSRCWIMSLMAVRRARRCAGSLIHRNDERGAGNQVAQELEQNAVIGALGKQQMKFARE